MTFTDDLNPSNVDLDDMTMFIAEKLQFLANPLGKIVRLKKQEIVDMKPGDIFIGIDRRTHESIIWRDEEISTHYCFVGSTGSGKTSLAENVIAKLYFQQNNIFTCIIDIKGEWYESLLYKIGGKELSHLSGRIHKMERYEKGMIRNLATEDNIIVFDFSSYSFINDIVDLYTQIRDFVADIADWINKPKGNIQLNCLFEESALWFPNARSEFNEIFTAYDDMANEKVKREMIDMEKKLAYDLIGIKDRDERRILTQEVKLDKLNIQVDKIWSFIKEIKAMAVSSILLARSRQCSIGFLIQRASLVLTTMITQVGTKFIKRQTDKNDIDRIKATVGYLSFYLKDMRLNECVVVSPHYQSYCSLDRRITHHVSENPKIKHYKSTVF